MKPDVAKLVVAAIAVFVATACAGVSVRLVRPVSITFLKNMSDVYVDVVQVHDMWRRMWVCTDFVFTGD
jgi:hypothetical protein